VDVELTSEQQTLQRYIGEFAGHTLAPGALERAHADAFPRDVAQQLAKQGLLGITVPTDKGGQGGTLMDAVIAIQAVAAHCPKSADIVQAGNFGPVRTFAEYAEPQLRKRFLPGLLRGDSVMSLGMTEPEAGSAVTDLATSARLDGDSYVVNGSKVFSTHSVYADLFLIYVRFGPGLAGIGSIVIERDTPGFTVGRPSTFMSGEQWCQLYFEDCRVPVYNLLLGAGGFKKQIAGFNAERLGNAARALAVGRYAFTEAVRHLSVREQFGRPLCEFQGLQWMFAEAAVKLESAQLLLYRAAARADDTGLPSAYDTAVAKFAANAAGYEAANVALQAMGATGYSQESLVEYCVRRTRGWQIAGGSSEILKNRIAETVFNRRFDQRPGTSSADRATSRSDA
jgi:alkylation response protein AidB-like acyl-CoA dehydrogenase